MSKKGNSDLAISSVSFVYDQKRESEWKEVYLALFEDELFEMLEEEVQKELDEKDGDLRSSVVR